MRTDNCCSCAFLLVIKLFSSIVIFPLAHIRVKVIYYALVRPQGWASFFENWKLEIKENYNSYNEIGWRNPS